METNNNRCGVCNSSEDYYAFGFCKKHYPMPHLVKSENNVEIHAHNLNNAKSKVRILNDTNRIFARKECRKTYMHIVCDSGWHKRVGSNGDKVYSFIIEKYITQ